MPFVLKKQMQFAVTQLILKTGHLKSQPNSLHRLKPQEKLLLNSALKIQQGVAYLVLIYSSNSWRIQWESHESCLLSLSSLLCPIFQLCGAFSGLPVLCSVPLASVGISSSLGVTFCSQINHLCNVVTVVF